MSLSRRRFVGSVSAGIAAMSAFGRYSRAESTAAATSATSDSGPLPVRISSNENPLGPSPKAREAALRACDGSNRYARSETRQLGELLRGKFGLPPAPIREPNSPDVPVDGPDLLIGIGSTEILNAAAWAYSGEPGNIVEPHPSYSALGTLAERRPGSQIQRRLVPLDSENRIDLGALLARVDAQTKLVMVCNPNNPTGTTLSRKAIEDFIDRVPKSALVFVDEAYIEFLPDCEQRSVMSSAIERPNVLVARTFSKIYGMAGLRVGYAVTSGQVAWRLRKNMQGDLSPNLPGISAAIAALDDESHLAATIELNNRIQRRFRDELPQVGLTYIPSEACFTWVEVGADATRLARFLAEREVFVAHGQRWDMPTWLRISVGTDAEMDRLFAGLKAFRAEQV